jgi:CRP-like cAMP-binding protein
LELEPLSPKLSSDLWEALQSIRVSRVYPQGEILFAHGTEVSGIFVIEAGLVRVLLPTSQIRPQLLETAGPGAILGLSESMSGEPYRVTAQAGDLTTAAFIPRMSFVDFLREHSDFSMQVVRLLSEDLHGLYHKFRSISAHPGRPRRRPLDEQLD